MPASDQGVSRNRYTLIPRTLIFVTHGRRVLLLKGAADKRLWANLYNGVGGHVERGEDILTSARRELAEETGLNVDKLWLCGVVTVDTNEPIGIGIYVLRGEIHKPAGEISPSLEGAVKWVPFEEVPLLPLVEDLYTLLPHVLEMKAGDRPFSAHYAYDEQDKMVITFSD